MRAPAVGWAFADPARRRAVGERLARTTHGDGGAVAAACAIADLAAAGLAGELRVPRTPAPAEPVSRDATATLAAVRHVLGEHDAPRGAELRPALAQGREPGLAGAEALARRHQLLVVDGVLGRRDLEGHGGERLEQLVHSPGIVPGGPDGQRGSRCVSSTV